jgi:hypothetical protein
MPCLLLILFLAFPRIALLLLFIFSNYLQRAYHELILWNLIGFYPVVGGLEEQDPIVFARMVALPVVMFHILLRHSPHRRFSKQDQPRQIFFFDRLHPSVARTSSDSGFLLAIEADLKLSRDRRSAFSGLAGRWRE